MNPPNSGPRCEMTAIVVFGVAGAWWYGWP
jgi:hypothetical protein